MDHPREVQVREFLQPLETLDGGEELEKIKAVCESYAYLIQLVRDENMTIDRLHEIVFGSADQADGARGTRRNRRQGVAGRRALRRRLIRSKTGRAAR
jgi:hypothetical protein